MYDSMGNANIDLQMIQKAMPKNTKHNPCSVSSLQLDWHGNEHKTDN